MLQIINLTARYIMAFVFLSDTFIHLIIAKIYLQLAFDFKSTAINGRIGEQTLEVPMEFFGNPIEIQQRLNNLLFNKFKIQGFVSNLLF